MYSSEDFFREGNKKLIRRDYIGAIVDFTKIIETDPNHSSAFINRGFAKNKLNDTIGELKDCNSALVLNPDNIFALFNRCVARIKLKDYLKAINDLTKFLCLRSSFGVAHFYRTVERDNLKYYSESVADILKALEMEPILICEDKNIDPDDLAIHNYIVTIAEHTKYITNGSPLLAEAYRQRAELRVQYHDFSGALDDYIKIISYASHNYNLYAKMAYIKDFHLKDYEGALFDYNKALNIDPEDKKLLLERSKLKYTLNDLDGSMSDLSTIIELFNKLDPKDNDDSEFFCEMAYFERAHIKSELNDLNGAINDYSEAIKLNPSFFFAYSGRASVKLKLKDFNGAIDDCTISLRISKEFEDAYLVRGKAKFELQDYNGSLRDFNKALKRNSLMEEVIKEFRVAIKNKMEVI